MRGARGAGPSERPLECYACRHFADTLKVQVCQASMVSAIADASGLLVEFGSNGSTSVRSHVDDTRCGALRCLHMRHGGVQSSVVLT